MWGNASTGLVTLSAAVSNAPQTLTVYGNIAPGQNIGIGSYTDSVQITVTY